MAYKTNIIKETEKNSYFRKVLFTGAKSQLVVMDIKPGESIGEETHPNVEQTLFFLNGAGKAIINGKEISIIAGDVFVITPGTKHDFLNTGKESLKVYTIYAPANHIDMRVHETKTDAVADIEDEEFGNKVV
jgi:mannose-6-phosphate isomerase-like protein (cupin superfamily)